MQADSQQKSTMLQYKMATHYITMLFYFDEHGNWTIVQQGMNRDKKLARRYHWISDGLTSFVHEPHAGIICIHKAPNTLNMASIDSAENQKICMELARDNVNNLKSSVRKVTEAISAPIVKKEYLG